MGEKEWPEETQKFADKKKVKHNTIFGKFGFYLINRMK